MIDWEFKQAVLFEMSTQLDSIGLLADKSYFVFELAETLLETLHFARRFLDLLPCFVECFLGSWNGRRYLKSYE